MSFTTDECAWKQTSIKILGHTLVGIQGFELGMDIEKEYLYGAGGAPIDIQEGNESAPGSIKCLKYEVDKMNDAALAKGYLNILYVPHTLIVMTCQFKKLITSPTRTIVVTGIAFTSLKYAMEQNAKMIAVPLPFLSMSTIIS